MTTSEDEGPLRPELERLARLVAAADPAAVENATAAVAATVDQLLADRFPDADDLSRQWMHAEALRQILIRARDLVRLALLTETTAGTA